MSQCGINLDLTFLLTSVPISDPSFSDDMSDMGSDEGRGPHEPAVKRERIEINHSLQEI